MEWKPKQVAIVAGIALVALIGLIFITHNYKWNSIGKQVLIQELNGGQRLVNKQGFYWTGLGQCNEWPQVSYISVGSYEGGKDDVQEADVDAIAVSFRGSAAAKQSLLAQIDLPTDKTTLCEIQRQFPGGYPNFIRKGILPEIAMATATAANLLEGEEALNNLSSYKYLIQDQLAFGLYKLESHIENDTNDAKEVERRNSVKIKIGADGLPERIPLKLKSYGVNVSSIQIVKPEFDSTVQAAINNRRNASLSSETAKKTRIAAEQQKLAAIATGETNVITKQYEIQVKNASTVALAQLALDSSALALKAAANIKQATILLAEGESQAKKMVMAADGYREKQMNMEIQKTQMICDAMRDTKVKWVPDNIIGGTVGTNGMDAFSNAMKMLNVTQLQGMAGNK